MHVICLLSLVVCSNAFSWCFPNVAGRVQLFLTMPRCGWFQYYFQESRYPKILHVDVFTPEDGTDTLSWNFGNKLPIDAAQLLRRSKNSRVGKIPLWYCFLCSLLGLDHLFGWTQHHNGHAMWNRYIRLFLFGEKNCFLDEIISATMRLARYVARKGERQGRRLRVASGATAPGPALEGAPRFRPMSLSSCILR